jgi:sirohydrochlorin ferrochelatase
MSDEESITGVLLFAHGSRVEEANQGVHDLARQVQSLGPYGYVRATFLELAHPNLGEAVAEAVEAGMRRVVVIPCFLTMGIHLRRDLPSLIAPEREKYPHVEIEVGQSLEGHPLMATIILGRVKEVIGTTKLIR